MAKEKTPKTETEVETPAAAEAAPEVETPAETETAPEAEAAPEVEAAPEAEAEAETAPEADAEVETAAPSEAETEAETAPEPATVSDLADIGTLAGGETPAAPVAQAPVKSTLAVLREQQARPRFIRSNLSRGSNGVGLPIGGTRPPGRIMGRVKRVFTTLRLESAA